MTKKIRINISQISPILLGLVLLLITSTETFSGFDNLFFDSLLKIKTSISKREQTPRIISIDLSDNTELIAKKDIDSRQIFVDALTVIQKSDCTAGFDFVFSDDKIQQIDDVFANISSEVPNCVFAVTPLSQTETNFSGRPMNNDEIEMLKKSAWNPVVINHGNIPEASRFLLPYNKLALQANILAHIGVQPDSDGVYRRLPLFYSWNGSYLPSYSMAIAASYLSIDTSKVIINAGKSVTLFLPNGTSISIPVDNECRVYIPYTGKWSDTGKHIPLEKFAEGATNEDTFWELFDIIEDNTLLFSDLSTAKKDFGISPLESVYPLAGIHTTILNGILTDSFIRPLPIVIKILYLVLITIGIILFSFTKTLKSFSCIFLSLFFSMCIITLVLWFAFSIVPWCSGLLISIVSSGLLSFLFREFKSYKSHLLMENALSRYFPRALASRILKEGKTELIPTKKELTMLFSDIAGFTKWSSNKKPEIVHSFLTDYLGSMADIIFAHGGTVDKFIGDGMLAFFGDPFIQEDHSTRAVSAAIDMQKKVRELAVKWKPLADIDLKIRIGINSGEVIVGNLGTGQRIDYTVIGAAVNLASRMESNAPIGGILVAENTYEQVKDLFPFSEALEITAKGYEKPVEAFVVTLDFINIET